MSELQGSWNRKLGLAMVLLAGSLALFEVTSVDLWLQDHFYNRTTHQWLVDENEPIGRAMFYDGPKIVIWAIALVALIFAAGPARWRERAYFNRRGLWLALLVIATVPVLAGVVKKYTNTFCPSEIRRYGGDVPYVKLCEAYPADDKPAKRGGCFPAGHASGGFALMGLLAVRNSRRWRNRTIVAALLVGGWMGIYQMLKGAHYLSHTVTTLLMAWIVVLLLQRALKISARPEA